MGRTAIFIDGGYVDKLLSRHFDRASIAYDRFVDILAPDCDILRSSYYHCPPYQSSPPTEEERTRFSKKQKFFNALSQLNRFQVRQGKLERRGVDANGRPIFMQKRVDIMLSVDMVLMAATRQVDHVVLVAGDSDFVPAIEVTKPLGVLVTLWHGPRGHGLENTVHRALWNVCDERHELTQEIINSVRR